MALLDIVADLAAQRDVAAKWPHRMKADCYPYLFTTQSHNLRACRNTAAVRQAGCARPVHTENDKWRNRCPRASSHSSRLALWPSWRPAAKTNQLKSSLWLTQSRSQPSQPTLANTSKAHSLSIRTNREQAAWPACTTQQVMRIPLPQQKGALA